MTTNPTTQSELLEAQQFCQKLWPAANIRSKTDGKVWVIYLEVSQAICVEVVGRPLLLMSEASASCEPTMSPVVARSSRGVSVHWKDAVLDVAKQLEVLAGQIKPDIVGALEGDGKLASNPQDHSQIQSAFTDRSRRPPENI
jgi:hypothetical protein